MSPETKFRGNHSTERDQVPGSRRRSWLWLIVAAGAGVLLVFLLLQIPIARVGPGSDTITAWEELQAFRHLSLECQFDWATMYVFAGADAGGVAFFTMLSEVFHRGLVHAVGLAWAAASEDWNHFVARGSAEMEHGLKNVNPMCPLHLPSK